MTFEVILCIRVLLFLIFFLQEHSLLFPKTARTNHHRIHDFWQEKKFDPLTTLGLKSEVMVFMEQDTQKFTGKGSTLNPLLMTTYSSPFFSRCFPVSPAPFLFIFKGMSYWTLDEELF